MPAAAELLMISDSDTDLSNYPENLIPLVSKVDSSTLESVLPKLFRDFVAADDLNHAEQILTAHPDLIAVTREGDVIGRGRARGGSTRVVP